MMKVESKKFTLKQVEDNGAFKKSSSESGTLKGIQGDF